MLTCIIIVTSTLTARHTASHTARSVPVRRRYGRKAQRCFCGSAHCRGWIGRKPDEQTPESADEEEVEEEETATRAGPARKADRARMMRRDAARREVSVWEIEGEGEHVWIVCQRVFSSRDTLFPRPTVAACPAVELFK